MLLTKINSINKIGLLSIIPKNLTKILETKSFNINNNNDNKNVDVLRRFYASPPASSSVAKITTGSQPIGKRKFRLPVETDVHKLVTHCCGANYHKSGEEIKLKEDSEYPEWIWSLRLNYPPPLHEMDPNTKEFYERLAVVGQQREWRLTKVWRQRFKIVNQHLKNLEELRYRRRSRALAKYEFDAGYEVLPHHEREDYWNLDKKEHYRLPEETEPFYPGVDKVELDFKHDNKLRFRKSLVRVGHFGC